MSPDKQSHKSIHDVVRLAEVELKAKNFLKSATLLDAVFDGKDAYVANFLGYIYCDEKSPLHDLDKGMKFYQLSAEAGDLYGQQGLAAALKEDGNIEEAVNWMIKASENGGPDASLILSLYFQKNGDRKNRMKYLLRAAEQGQVLAIQKIGIMKLFGRFGVYNIPSGIRDLIGNWSKIIKLAKETIAESPEHFK